jgi:glycosyltransferase involved in cell wall biosynthesis
VPKEITHGARALCRKEFLFGEPSRITEITDVRIAQVSQLYEAVPPNLYGGTERVVSWITEALVDLGHDVTLFASGDSVTRAKHERVIPQAIRLGPAGTDVNAIYVQLLETVRRRAEEFDILHFHIDALSFPLFSRQKTAFVTTLHGRLDLPEYGAVYGMFPKVPLISISNAQRAPLPNANWAGTVLHGMPTQLLTPQAVEPTYLAFLGRISPEKGIEAAIRIARASGLTLRIAAKVDRVDEEYFRSKIEPAIDGKGVEFVGEINDHEKLTFLSGAIALLFPIAWPESFGLTMIEAMACGTPVIAFNRASVPEVLDEGITGFIVTNEREAVSAVPRAAALSRQRVREQFEARFSDRRMATEYVTIYQRLIG